ncbi:MAG: hypothetical protein C0427_02905 [Rhodobacter sp.]|nr:hypothetical protein [Rhodobacter sp.]
MKGGGEPDDDEGVHLSVPCGFDRDARPRCALTRAQPLTRAIMAPAPCRADRPAGRSGAGGAMCWLH